MAHKRLTSTMAHVATLAFSFILGHPVDSGAVPGCSLFDNLRKCLETKKDGIFAQHRNEEVISF